MMMTALLVGNNYNYGSEQSDSRPALLGKNINMKLFVRGDRSLVRCLGQYSVIVAFQLQFVVHYVLKKR
jgi:hypothetical protein